MKKVKILLIALILVLGGVFFNTTYAAKGETRSLGASLTRPFENVKYQYAVPGETTDLFYTIVKIYDNNVKDTGGNLTFANSLYCLRGGIGFGAEDVSEDSVEYTEIGEMHADAKDIIANYLNKYKTGNVTGSEIDIDTEEEFTISVAENGAPTQVTKNVNLYNAILWIIDESYLPVDKVATEGEETIVLYDASKYKTELLDKAGVPTSQQADITDKDIEVIQQLAMWYFTNYDEQLAGTIPTVSQNTMFPAQFLSIDENIDTRRANNLDRLYQYFIYGAIENADTYKVDATTGARTKVIEENKFDTTNTLSRTSYDIEGIYDYYEIGPIKFEGNSGDRRTVDVSNIVLYDAELNPINRMVEIPKEEEGPDIPEGEGKIISDGRYVVYKFLDSDGKEVTDLIKGQTYKIRIYKAFEKRNTAMPDELYEKYDMSKFTIKVSSTYSLSNATFLSAENESQPVVEINKEKVSSSDEITTKYFDLSLRKYIIAVDENNLTGEITRIPTIDIEPLTTLETTAEYKHRKDPVEVETGSIVTYRFTVYNEGDIDGYVYSIVDYLPEGLEFDVESNPNFIEFKETYTEEELAVKEYAYKVEGNKITILPLTVDNLFELVAFNGQMLDSKSIDVKFKVTVTESNNDQVLTNVATMTYAAKGANISDRDSNIAREEFEVPTAEELLEGLPGYKGKDSNQNDLSNSDYYYEGQQDDDDFEKIIVKGVPFDLSLRKFITSIKRDGKELEFADRTPKIDTTTLIYGTFNRNNELEHTATYNHSKEPLTVKQGDIITYTLRIYNEGERAGYATEITDYIPEGLAFINGYDTNADNYWLLEENGIEDIDQIMTLTGENEKYKENFSLDDFTGITDLKEVELVSGKVKITTNLLDDQLLKPFDEELTEETAGEGWQKAETGESGLYYKDIEVSCLVIAENTCPDVLTNIAEISEDKDAYGKDVIDRDSIPNNKQEPYTTSQEDDDDYEPVVLRYFDLALRKFITGVETNGKLTEVTSRVPNLNINEETGNIKYTHPKEESPVEVANNDIVIYTLRVYNEGTLAGYAEELTDDIPEGLIFLPEHDVNKQYEWKMYDKDGELTDSLEEVSTIKTAYLSEENQKEDRNNLINPFDASKEINTEEPYNPDYKDVKVAFRVIEPNTSDKIIVNSAQISEDSDDDVDSTPDEWIDKEDDQDNEYIKVKYFDLSLLKWVTQTIVTVDGKTTTTETGFKPNTGLTETTGIRDNKENEPVAKVELDKKKLNKTTVKFAYKIRVTNEGEIAGYATEITDFVPKGLEFKAEDNKKYGWVKVGDDKVTTRALETVLLEPGESTELEIVFTWINDKNNLGVKTNIAEITEDYNEHNSKDIDSTPDNKKDPYEKEQEDDDDFALVVLSLKTGKGASYTILITAVIVMFAGGIYLIKKYVLTY